MTRNQQRGMSIFVVAMSLVVLLGVSALAIDLASLYLTRNEAQRAADAAALAGAQEISDNYFLGGPVSANQASAEGLATSAAIGIGTQNNVGGQPASITSGDVTFNFTSSNDPRVTVVVQRTQARGNPMRTLFGRAFGIACCDVSATATAEAYYPSAASGSTTLTGTICLKPWLLPNCDPGHVSSKTSPPNPNCSGSAQYFINFGTGAVVNPGLASSGGVVGEQITLSPAATPPGSALPPGQFYPLQETGSTLCPSAGYTSDAAIQQNTECCNTAQYYCGKSVSLDIAGTDIANLSTQVSQGVQHLINQGPGGSGQDYLQNTTSFPFQIIGGSDNPNGAAQGQVTNTSNSIVTLPLYDGAPVASQQPTIRGFLQLFVESVANPPSAAVTAYVVGASGCASSGGGAGSGSSAAVYASPNSQALVRLVSQ